MACSPLLIELRAVRRSQGGCPGDAEGDAPRAGRAGAPSLAARSGDGGGRRVVPRVSLPAEERPLQFAARREGSRKELARGRAVSGAGRAGRGMRCGAVRAARRSDGEGPAAAGRRELTGGRRPLTAWPKAPRGNRGLGGRAGPARSRAARGCVAPGGAESAWSWERRRAEVRECCGAGGGLGRHAASAGWCWERRSGMLLSCG